jgi:UDP-glucose 4-epimerase
VGKTEKAQKVLGWKPEHSSLENILKTAWVWHQNFFGKKMKAGKLGGPAHKKTKRS